MPHLPRAAALLAAVLLLATAPPARAQEHGGGGPGGPSSGQNGNMDGGMGPGMGNNGPPGFPSPDGSRHHNTFGMHGLHLGPPGRWWDDKRFVDDLGLKPEQQKRMDAIFNDNRATLTSHFQTLRDEEDRMETLSHSSSPDEDALFAQIDRVAQARASLEKALTHYLLGIRREMTPDQIARLDAHRER